MAKNPPLNNGQSEHGIVKWRWRDGHCVMRWRDPATRQRVEHSVRREGVTTPAQAEQWARRKERALMRVLVAREIGEPDPVEPVTITDGVERWLAAKPDLRPVTVTWYRKRMEVVAHVLEVASVATLDQLTPSALLAVRDAIVARYPLPANANGFLRALRAAANWWIDRGMVTEETDLKHVRRACARLKEPRTRPDTLTREQIDGLLWLAEGNEPDALPMLLCALLIGHRARAILNLHWEWFDVADRRLVVPAAYMKQGVEWVVDLDLIGPEFVAWLDRRPRRGAVWPLCHNEALRVFYRLERHGGVHANLQIFRQTCSTFLCATAGAFRESQQVAHGVLVAESRYVGNAPRDVQHGQGLVQAMGVAGYLEG